MEPEEFRLNTPWSYPQEIMNTMLFASDRDQDLISRIKDAIRKRL